MMTVLVTLIQNAALLLATMVVFDLVTSRKPVQGQWQRQALAGVILGGLCIGLMLASLRLETGIIFDTRSVLLSLSGLFLGPIPTLFAMAMAAAYRLWLGGPGVWTGIGVILATGGVGILWRHYRQGRLANISLRELYGFGVAAHLVMLALMLTLPWEAARRVLAGIGLPVLLVYPLVTVALGRLLATRFQRENASAALAASEQLYRGVFEAANVGKSVTLPSSEINVNRAFCDMLGYGLEELRGKTWQELTPPEDVPEIEGRIVSLLDGREDSTRFEKRYVSKDGSTVWADVSVTLLRDTRGLPLYFITTVVDITDRKRTDEALRQSENRLNRALENIPDVVVIYDKNLKIQYINAATRRVTGRPVSDFIGKREEEVWPPEVYQVYMPMLQESFNTGEVQSLDTELTFPNNDIRSLRITCVPLLDEKGAVREIMGITNDYTDRKRAEAELVDEAGRRRLLMEQSRDGIVILDRDGQVVESNRKFAEMLGYPQESMGRLNVRDWEFLHPPERLIEMLRSVDEKGDHFETRHRRRDGSLYDVEISTNAAWFAGQKLVLCICRDITDRKRAEEKTAEQLRELQRWHDVMLNREDRVIALKKELNELLARAGQPPRYPSAEETREK